MSDFQRDVLKETQTPAPQRKARRKSAAWKSGLMLTGLGAVVLGAGYLAGVNAPAVAQTAAQQTTPQSVAQTNEQANVAAANNKSQPLTSDEEFESEDGRVIGFDDQGNPVILNDDGSLQFGNGATESQAPSTQQFGRRGRQLGGFSQQAPSFSGPTTRSRGS